MKIILICLLFIACNISLNAQLSITADVYGNCANNTSTSNGTIAITAVGGGVAPYTYLWNNGSTNYILNNLATGTYTVTVTDANLVTATFSYTVAAMAGVAPIHPIATGHPAQCIGDKYGVTNTVDLQPLDVYDDYHWYTSTMANGLNAFNVFPFPTAGGSISFTAIDPGTGCSSTSNPVDVYPCCTGTYDMTYQSVTKMFNNAVALAALGIYITQVGNDFNITTDPGVTLVNNYYFEVNRNCTFDHVDVLCGPGAEFWAHGNRMTVTGLSHFHTCDHLYNWYGIIGGLGSLVEIIDSRIEEADTAIISLQGRVRCVHNTVLNRNNVSIHLENSDFLVTDALEIDRSIIQCNDAAGLSIELIAPYQNHQPVTGISLLNCVNIKIGNENEISLANHTTRNTFRNLHSGIIARNSNTTAYNNLFTDIRAYQYDTLGFAVNADGQYHNNLINDLTIGGVNQGITTVRQNWILNSQNGIGVFHNYNANIHNNTFDNIFITNQLQKRSFVMHLEGNTQSNFDIVDNKINNFRRGIHVLNTRNTNFNIENNIFNYDPSYNNTQSLYAIKINDGKLPNTVAPFKRIQKNKIAHCITGIYSLNYENITIDNL